MACLTAWSTRGKKTSRQQAGGSRDEGLVFSFWNKSMEFLLYRSEMYDISSPPPGNINELPIALQEVLVAWDEAFWKMLFHTGIELFCRGKTYVVQGVLEVDVEVIRPLTRCNVNNSPFYIGNALGHVFFAFLKHLMMKMELFTEKETEIARWVSCDLCVFGWTGSECMILDNALLKETLQLHFIFS